MTRPFNRLTCAALSLLIVGAAPAPAEYVVQGDGVVAATVEGKPVRLRIDPGAPALPILTERAALAAGLKPGMFGIGFTIGPVRLRGSTAVADFAVDGLPFKRRTAWFERPYGPDIDGVIGPGSLPVDTVRFVIHAPRPGERMVDLPLVDAGGLIGNWGGLFAEIQVGGEPMKVRFDLHHRDTRANAPAGVRIAEALGGALTGPVEQGEVAFGVDRPIRRMTLARPLVVGPLSLDDLRVRVSDYGSVGTVRDADATPDPDEIVVTAKGKKDRERARLSIGLDRLERCSSLVFDQKAKVVRLSCL